MLDGRVLEASQVEYKPFGKPPLQRERLEHGAPGFLGAAGEIAKLHFGAFGGLIPGWIGPWPSRESRSP